MVINTLTYKPLTKAAPSFAGDKDILIIDESTNTWQKRQIETILGDKAREYTIHEAIGGKEGLEKTEQVKPILTITAYNMREYPPYGVELIKALKKFGNKVIVLTSNWTLYGIESLKAGVKKCEEEAGADKYIYGMKIFDTIEDPIKRGIYENKHSVDKVLQETIKAIINGTSLPRYSFQDEVEQETNK